MAPTVAVFFLGIPFTKHRHLIEGQEAPSVQTSNQSDESVKGDELGYGQFGRQVLNEMPTKVGSARLIDPFTNIIKDHQRK